MSKKDDKNGQLSIKDKVTEFLLYTAPGDEEKVEVLLDNETIWLTRQRMTDLFGVQGPAITKHFKNIYESGELEATTKKTKKKRDGDAAQSRQFKQYSQHWLGK